MEGGGSRGRGGGVPFPFYQLVPGGAVGLFNVDSRTVCPDVGLTPVQDESNVSVSELQKKK